MGIMAFISEKKQKFRQEAEIKRQKEYTQVSAERQRLEQVKAEKDAINKEKARIREIRTEKVRNALKGFQEYTRENQKRSGGAKFGQSSNSPFSAPRSSLVMGNDPPGNRLVNQDPKGNRAVNNGPRGGVFGGSPLGSQQSAPRQQKRAKTIIIKL